MSNIRLTIFALLISATSGCLYGQKQFTLIVKSQDNDNKTAVVANFQLLIDGVPAKANQDGEIFYTTTNKAGPITITILDETKYVLVGLL